MRIPAEHFLKLRAIGAPAVVVYLAVQGIFRGFKDTKTPILSLGKDLVYCLKLHWKIISFVMLLSISISLTDVELLSTGLGNFSAVFFFPLLMYYFHLGVTGAAISTVLSQYVTQSITV